MSDPLNQPPQSRFHTELLFLLVQANLSNPDHVEIKYYVPGEFEYRIKNVKPAVFNTTYVTAPYSLPGIEWFAELPLTVYRVVSYESQDFIEVVPLTIPLTEEHVRVPRALFNQFFRAFDWQVQPPRP